MRHRLKSVVSEADAELEPAGEIDATISVASGCENQPTPRAANALHGSDSNCLLLSSLEVDLQEVVAAWGDIPQSIRQGSLGARSIVGATQKVTGFEPGTGLDATALLPEVCKCNPPPGAALALQTSGTNCRFLSLIDTDLQRVVEAWVNMTRETRTAILDLIG